MTMLSGWCIDELNHVGESAEAFCARCTWAECPCAGHSE